MTAEGFGKFFDLTVGGGNKFDLQRESGGVRHLSARFSLEKTAV